MMEAQVVVRMKEQYIKMVETRRKSGSYNCKSKEEIREKRRLWQIEYRKTTKGKTIYDRYAKSDICKEKVNIRMRELRKTDKYKEWRKEYDISDKRKEVNLKYTRGDKFKMQQRRYLESPKGKLYAIKRQTRRKKNMKFIQLMDNPFPKEIFIDWHHINNLFVVPMPRNLHQAIGGNRAYQ